MFTAARPNWVVVLIASAALPASFAQTAGPVSQTPGTNTQVELTYRSPLDSYQRFSDEKVGSWRDANDTVGRIGGWRAYAKEGREPAAPGTPVPTGSPMPGAPAPAANPHAGHGKQ